jgi:hypothetical protein
MFHEDQKEEGILEKEVMDSAIQRGSAVSKYG